MVVGKILFVTFQLYSDNLLQATEEDYQSITTVKSKIYRQH